MDEALRIGRLKTLSRISKNGRGPRPSGGHSSWTREWVHVGPGPHSIEEIRSRRRLLVRFLAQISDRSIEVW